MKLLIGLDVGTSAVKAVLAAEDGRHIRTGNRPVRLLRPEKDRVELDPEEHYRTVCGLIGELAASVPPGDRVAALAMSFASGNTLLLDAEGRPLTNIIDWLDRRTVGAMGDLLPSVPAESVYRTVGWPGIDTFPLAHLAWLRRHRADAWGRTAHFAMNSDWLNFRLTGRWGMDHSTATTFYLQNQAARAWHAPFLQALGIGEETLSPLAPSGTVLGPLTAQAARDTGLPADTAVVLGSFDHPSAARGTGTLAPGDLMISCGTSWVGFYPCADRELLLSQNLLVDPFLSPAGPWAGMFSLTAVGVTVDWFLDHLIAPGTAGAERYRIFNEAAMAAEPGAGGLFLDPFQDPAAFADRSGELRRHGAAALARALMEGTAFRMRGKLESMAAAGLGARRIAMVGGPSESPIWPRILAEITGLELSLGGGQTAGAVGAAVMAGLGIGVFRDLAEGSRRFTQGGLPIRPSGEAMRRYDGLWARYKQSAGLS